MKTNNINTMYIFITLIHFKDEYITQYYYFNYLRHLYVPENISQVIALNYRPIPPKQKRSQASIQLTLSNALSLKKARFEGIGKAYNYYHKLFILSNTANYGVTMTLKFNAENYPSIFFSTAGLMIMLMVTASLCLACAQEEDNASQAMISKDEASQMVIDTLVKNLTENSDLKMGLRVNQYPDLLDANTEVREASADETMPSRVLVCQNASWLFFLDLAPGAHFAHPAIIAVLDAVSGEIQTMDARWWPVLVEPVFDDETQRRDPETIIFEKEPNL